MSNSLKRSILKTESCLSSKKSMQSGRSFKSVTFKIQDPPVR